MKKNELISVIVPVYNVEKYLNKCINSIINQTYKNIEIILVNDGSTDKSLQICNDFKKKDNRIIVIDKSNGGLSDARNRGIEEATGAFIAFVDSDDYIDSKMIETLYNIIKKYEADISIVNYFSVLEDEKVEIDNFKIQNTIVMNSKTAIEKLLDKNSFGNYAWNKLYKKELFTNVRFPFDKKMEDLGTTYKLFDVANRIVFNPVKLYYYIQRDGSILHNIDLKLIKDQYELTIERYNYLKEKYPNLKENQRFLYSYFIHDYAILCDDKTIKDNVDFVLKRFNINTFCNLKLREKIKYIVYSISRKLYIRIRSRGKDEKC